MGEKVTIEQQPRDKVAKLMPNQSHAVDKETVETASVTIASSVETSVSATAVPVGTIEVKLEDSQADVTADET